MAKSITAVLDNSGILTLTINVVDRPMNLVTPELRDALSEAIDRVSSDAAIKGAILTSGKADFMAGGDLPAMLDRMERQLDTVTLFERSSAFGRLLRKLETCGKPVVAAINGLALGGGFELALACHYRVVSDLPKLLVGLPEVTVGLMPGAGGTQRLSRMLGAEAAVPILLQGKNFLPAEALKRGLVDAVVPPETLLQTAGTWILEGGDCVKPWDRKTFMPPGGGAIGDQSLNLFYEATATTIARDTQHNRPASIAILTAVAQGLPLPFDAGMRVETRQFVKLFRHPSARNIVRTQFVGKGAADKLARRPVGPPTKRFTKLGVLGAGLMGAGIAQVASAVGLDVVLMDATSEGAEKGKQRIAAALEKQVSRGAISANTCQEMLSRITATADYEALRGAELVIEAVFENREVKLDVLKKAHSVMGDDAIYASNTSTIPITTLADSISLPDHFIGLHFFSPVDRMALVEVVRAKQTSDETLASALDFVKRIRKTPIVVNDSRGFFTSRLFSSYLAEALGMVAEGVHPALIENGAKQAGFPIGPLALVDITTLELAYAAANQTRRDLGDAWVPSPSYPVQKMFVEVLDRKGKRYGKGFYDYPADGPKRLWAGMRDVYLLKPIQPSVEEVKHRLLFIQSMNAVRCFDENVITSVVDGDVGSTLGIGFPVHTGGVFSLIDTVGVARFVKICDQFADVLGERWRPTESLRRKAALDETFYPRPLEKLAI